MTIRRYSLARPYRTVLALIVIPLMLVVTSWSFYKQISHEQPGGPQLALWGLWVAGLLFFAFGVLTSARELVVHENDEIEFVSVLERQRLMARDIRSIRVLERKHTQIVVRHTSGKIYLAGAMNDFHQFVTDLKRANPGVELVGC